jgi:hypothetical protein
VAGPSQETDRVGPLRADARRPGPALGFHSSHRRNSGSATTRSRPRFRLLPTRNSRFSTQTHFIHR